MGHNAFSAELKHPWVYFAIILLSALGFFFAYALNMYIWRNCPYYGWRYKYEASPHLVTEVFELGKRAGLKVDDYIPAVRGKECSIFCSAGQMFPVHFDREKGHAYLVAPRGDAIPLGIMEDSLSQDTHVQLSSGDRVVFYTDGVVEAMNRQGQMYGFERLINMVKECACLPSMDVIDRIVGDVRIFRGGEPQQDDITLIVIDVE